MGKSNSKPPAIEREGGATSTGIGARERGSRSGAREAEPGDPKGGGRAIKGERESLTKGGDLG